MVHNPVVGPELGVGTGAGEGSTEGLTEGDWDGRPDGVVVGDRDGRTDGRADGFVEGDRDGVVDGEFNPRRQQASNICSALAFVGRALHDGVDSNRPLQHPHPSCSSGRGPYTRGSPFRKKFIPVSA